MTKSNNEAYLDVAGTHWKEGDPKPPWKPPPGNFDAYCWTLIDFVVEHLELGPEDPDSEKWHAEWRANHGPEIRKAMEGDIEPLRRKLPHLAEFLHLPPGPVGKRKTGGYLPSLTIPEWWFTDTVDEVNAVWAKHYGKKVRKKLKPTTNEVVAFYFDVDVEEVERARRLMNQQRRRAKAKEAQEE